MSSNNKIFDFGRRKKEVEKMENTMIKKKDTFIRQPLVHEYATSQEYAQAMREYMQGESFKQSNARFKERRSNNDCPLDGTEDYSLKKNIDAVGGLKKFLDEVFDNNE